NQVVAVDAATGAEAWRVRIGDINRGETMTMAPLVVKGKVIVGNSGGEFGVRGWIMALDAATGRIAWKAYATGPDEEVLIGPGFRPFYPLDRGRDLGVRSWPPSMWQTGGATAWGWVSYDPALDLIYYGTGNAGPWNPELRPGDNKWSATIFARDPDDGRARWAYQFDPHNDQDYDAINESILLDVRDRGGRTRQALIRAERNGYVYLMDRGTGQVISADTFTYVTTVRRVDTVTGQPDKVSAKSIKTGEVTRLVCPAVQGSKNYSPAAYSPRTRLVYFPSNNLCMDVIGTDANYIAGTPYLGTIQIAYAAPGHTRGTFFAWDPERRRKAWAIPEYFPVWGGALATAGDVVFYGTMDRWFKAVDARTGKELWKFRTGSSVIAQPISFRGPDGRQYVAVYDGVGGWAGTVVSLRLSPDDSTAGDGMVGAMTDLPRYTDKGGTLYVFRLP
ncbi:MAG TPA: PQQ-binding-like beta-propeller repeat protein, partial [Gemmatimonadaceae bacterium]|nr:PQQ-binding-like beta-propeller repeat protein [Gemmatimonadaceae bacterium]